MSLPSLQELAGQSLLRNEKLAISALETLPNLLLPQLFKQAYEGGHRNVLKKIVSSWPFPRLPLGAVKKRNASESLENAVLEEVDKLLIQSPREYKLEVLDLRSVGQEPMDVLSGPVDSWLPQTSCEGEKKPLKVAVNLYLRNGNFNKLSCLSQWAEKRKGLLQLYCHEFHIWLPFLSGCKCYLEYVNLQYIVVLGLHSLHNPAEFLDLISYLGHLMNLRKLSISNIQEERVISLEERRHIVSGLASKLLNLECLQELHLENASFFKGHLHKLLRSLKTPLDDLAVTHCTISVPEWNQFSKLICVSQLQHLSLENVRLASLSPEPLRILLVKAAHTLVDLNLEDCHIKDSYLYAILPALSRCLQLRTFSFYGNPLSMGALKRLLRSTANLENLYRELYPVPRDCYVDNGTLHMELTRNHCNELIGILKTFWRSERIYFGTDRCHRCNNRYIYNKTSMCRCRRFIG
ncbi:PRAME family member 20 [Cricetulus griseus]|uniref:PRAME family member 20 n=1 Tax=Cricetulus griseus TaxID=10029 RepID=G3IIA3_CRIGR|nr:PRAME family member 20 [Cricetulus griseus]XP_027253923.1 PRAME family member 20 [Cricetulus griseus]EGW14390.1 PRAME family member 20/21 [Cricetulus griseus]ERE83531.1 hypothetical protein H671_2g6637 [Cricetulus griseus]